MKRGYKGAHEETWRDVGRNVPAVAHRLQEPAPACWVLVSREDETGLSLFRGCILTGRAFASHFL